MMSHPEYQTPCPIVPQTIYRPEFVKVFVPGSPVGERGVIAAQVKVRSSERTEILALSCLHVFGALSAGSGRPHQGALVYEGRGKVIAIPRFYGSIRPWRYVRDVALARITRLQEINEAMVFPKPEEYAHFLEDIESHPVYDIWTARGRKPAVFQKHLTRNTPLENRQIIYEPFHHPSYFKNIIVSRTTGQHTVGGDSGSPVISRDGKVLLGMHIAGNTSSSLSYMIPAFELFRADYYNNLPAGASLELAT